MAQQPHVLFARVGWMERYNGVQSERPIGGGKYNRKMIGHEAYNFEIVEEKCYGYFQPQVRSSTVNLARIAQGARGDKLEDVLVVFVATWPPHSEAHGQTIVGWYTHACLYRKICKPTPGGRPKNYGYRCITEASNMVLLPREQRTFEVTKGKGGFGRANVRYRLSARGKPQPAAWMAKALAFIAGYDPSTQATPLMETAVENESRRAQGQGFGLNVAERQAVEALAMQSAKAYYRKKNYTVKDVSHHKSYDLECHRHGKELHVEVKGTTTLGTTVFLTKGEVDHAEKQASGTTALYILHSIKLVGKVASGGIADIRDPWQIKPKNLVPVGYKYTV